MNPLKKFLVEHDMSSRQFAYLSGLNQNTVWKIANCKTNIGNLKLSTLLKIESVHYGSLNIREWIDYYYKSLGGFRSEKVR